MEQVFIILNQCFEWILTTSIMASVMVGLILLVKTIFKERLNIRWHYLLWFLVIARLIIPWTPESSFSIYNFISLGSTNFEFNSQIIFDDKLEYLSERNSEHTSPSNVVDSLSETSVNKSEKLTSADENNRPIPFFFTLLSFAWLIGIFSLVTYLYIVNKKFARKVKSGTLISDPRIIKLFDQCKRSMRIQKNIPLIKTTKIKGTTLYCSFQTKLLLPEQELNSFSDNELIYIFHHELAHFKRKDITVNWVMTCLLILHWFNPIIWYAYYRIREDQELACDALALTFIHPKETTQYGYTIIKLLENSSRFPSPPGVAGFSGNKAQLRRRIKMIKLFSRGSYKWSILGLIIVILLAVFALTDAESVEVEKEDYHVDHENWELRTEYEENGNELFSIYPEPGHLYAGEYYGYMIHFTEPFETFKGKELAMYAYHMETGSRVNVVAPKLITEPSPGYSSLDRFTTTFELPLSGLWRYEVVLDEEFYGDVVLQMYEPNRDKLEWKVSSLFKSGDYTMIGQEGRLGFIYTDAEVTRFYPNKQQKYMWHFWGEAEELEGNLEVVGVSKETGEEIMVFETSGLDGANNGADAHTPSGMSLPSTGLWRLDAYIEKKYFGSVIVEVQVDPPDIVQESDFETIDWERKAVEFGDRGIVGNENKSGSLWIGGPNEYKWMWHLWGVENVELTVVGYHRETGTVHQVLFTTSPSRPSRPVGYWTRNVMGANNGADAHMPSSVKIPEPGEWAMLLYTDGELFDVLVYDLDLNDE